MDLRVIPDEHKDDVIDLSLEFLISKTESGIIKEGNEIREDQERESLKQSAEDIPAGLPGVSKPCPKDI